MLGSLTSIAVKRRVARAITSPVVGKMVRFGGRQQRLSGVLMDLDEELLSPRVIGFLKWKLYEKAELRLIESQLRPDLDVIELGASVGVVSVHVARKLQPGRQLVCVEAHSGLIGPLRRTLERNGVAAQVEHAALAYGVPEVPFSIGSESFAGQLGTGAEPAVRATTLGYLRSQHGIDRFTLVCDIEGAEIQLLENDIDALAFCDQIIIELHATVSAAGEPVAVDQLKDWICGLGFRVEAGSYPVFAFARD